MIQFLKRRQRFLPTGVSLLWSHIGLRKTFERSPPPLLRPFWTNRPVSVFLTVGYLDFAHFLETLPAMQMPILILRLVELSLRRLSQRSSTIPAFVRRCFLDSVRH